MKRTVGSGGEASEKLRRRIREIRKKFIFGETENNNKEKIKFVGKTKRRKGGTRE